MSVKSLLLWEKWRPKTFEDIILLPRIRKQFELGVTQHYIFYGHYGTGKTSLSRILVGKYTKESAFMEVNCSEETSIDFLRDEISNFCKTRPMFETDSDIKYVFLDEFERVSANFQDAFKAFIERYNDKVRFIITTNHIEKIGGGLKSRIKSIDFDCQNIEEERFLKKEMFLRIQNSILPSENKEVGKEDLVRIVTKKFPDFRSILVEVQDFLETGNSSLTGNVSNKMKQELYNTIFDYDSDYDKTYHFLMCNFGPEKIDQMIKLLSRPFVEYVSEKQSQLIPKLFECNYVISDYSSKLESNTDPIILGMTIIGKFRDILL
jgi:replication-associated recombination protein RarA